MTALSNYKDSVQNLPASGGGGCNQSLLGAANHGVYAGVDPQQIHDDLRDNVHGTRKISDQEIKRAIDKAVRDKSGTVIHYDFKKREQKQPTIDGPKALKKISDQGQGAEEPDIWAASPIKIDWPHEEDPPRLLQIYNPDDILFIGERYSSGNIGRTIRTASEWQQYFIGGGKTFPHIIPNPLTGKQGLTQDNKPTLRGDACVKSFRLAVVEFDNLNREEQLAFWWAVDLPVVALIDSGNKSIHGWIMIDGISTADEWTTEVEQQLFKQLLIPMGVDGACRNEARLSRLPGHQRDNGKMQRLLYLAPEGRRVNV